MLILDNVETILAAGDETGKYRSGCEEYSQLLEKIASVPHKSCLLLTSRERINNIERFSGKDRSIRFLELAAVSYTHLRAHET